jgi:hypothetical protein
MAAICENGHDLEVGTSKCGVCGARMKMQWMPDNSPTDPRQAPLALSDAELDALEQTAVIRKSRSSVSLWPLLLGGIVAVIVGIAIGANDPDSGVLFVAVGSIPLTIWTIAIGVEMGIRSSWRHE